MIEIVKKIVEKNLIQKNTEISALVKKPTLGGDFFKKESRVIVDSVINESVYCRCFENGNRLLINLNQITKIDRNGNTEIC